MINRSIVVEADLWDACRAKAKKLPIPLSISAVVRRLLQLWLTGKIEL